MAMVYRLKVKNTRMVFSQGQDPLSDKRETLELPTTACQFDKVVIQGKGYVSTEALERFAESNINVIIPTKCYLICTSLLLHRCMYYFGAINVKEI